MIYLAYRVEKYRELLKKVAKPGKTILEIGPHVGLGTKLLKESGARVICVDKAAQSEDAVKKLGVEFVKGDVRFFDTVRDVQKIIKRCDVLCFDMGGGRFPDTVFKVWAIWSGVFRPKDSVIRNRGLAEFIQRVKIEDEHLIRDFEDDGWLKAWGRRYSKEFPSGLEEMKLWMEK